MSRENVETVRAMWQAFAEDGMGAMTRFWDPEINWRAIEGAPDDVGEMVGAEAVQRYLQEWLDTFENITSVPEELIDAGEGRVIALFHVTGRARLSGIQTELRYAVLYTLREDRIVRVREYAEKAEALRAAGRAQ